jgi:hypothetical protein
MTVLAQLTSDDVLDSANEWLCRRRRDYSANADVWAFRRNWPRELLSRVTLKDGEETDLWSARDALVLKALALVLVEYLPFGPKYAVRAVRDHVPENRFVLRTRPVTDAKDLNCALSVSPKATAAGIAFATLLSMFVQS